MEYLWKIIYDNNDYFLYMYIHRYALKLGDNEIDKNCIEQQHV